MSKKLTQKQRSFVNHYLKNGFNATQAAISAGYSKNTSYSQGQRLLKNVEIKEELENRQQKKQKQHEIDLDYIITEYQKIMQDPEATLTDKNKTLQQLTHLLGLDATFKLKKELSNRENDNDSEQPTIVISV